MRAITYAAFGDAASVLELRNLPEPAAAADEVVVRLGASGVNPLDVKRRAGARGRFDGEWIVPHYDGAGEIVAVGSAVDSARIGERVWVCEANLGRHLGTAAEFVAIAADRAAPLGGTASFAEGACLGIPAITAHRAIFIGGPVEAKTVLVTGGGGAVGSYAVQFARLGGARTIATVSSDAKAAQATADGADHVVNYRREDVVARVRELTDGAGVDHICEVELGGNLAVSAKILNTGGAIATYASMAVPEPPLPFYAILRYAPSIHLVSCFNMADADKQRALADIGGWLTAGALSHHVGATFALADTAAAHEAVEGGGVIGNVVVTIDGD